MGTADVEEDAHRNSLDTTCYDNHPLVPETYVGSPTLGPGALSSAPETSMLDTLTTLMPTKRRVEASDGAPGEIFFAGQPSNNCQSTQYLSKYQPPTVEDAPDETENNNAEDPFANDDNFGDSDVEAVLEEAHKFLGDTSADHESPSSGATNTMNTELGLNAPDLAFCPPDSDDRYALPNKEQTDIPQASSQESREICRKRRLSSIIESQPTLPSRNLRARLLNSVGEKTSGPPNLDKDRWKGRFSHHTLLSTLLPN